MTRINKSWREQRKAVVATDKDGKEHEWQSVWTAANYISDLTKCKHETAKREIRKAIRTKVARYGMSWKWKDVVI